MRREIAYADEAEIRVTCRLSDTTSQSDIPADRSRHCRRTQPVIPDAEQAFDYLVSKARPEDAVFVTGSLYLVGRLRHYWKQRAQVAAGLKNTVKCRLLR